MKLVYFSRLVAIISVTSLVHNVPNLPSPSTATIRRRRGNTSGSKLEKISRMEEISKDEKSCQEAKHNIVTLKKLSDESTSTKSTQAAPTAPTNYSSPLTSISKNAFSVVKVAHCVKKGAPIFGTAVVANETLSLIGLYGCESLGFTAVRLIAAAGLTTGAAAAVEAIALGVNSLLNESGLLVGVAGFVCAGAGGVVYLGEFFYNNMGLCGEREEESGCAGEEDEWEVLDKVL